MNPDLDRFFCQAVAPPNKRLLAPDALTQWPNVRAAWRWQTLISRVFQPGALRRCDCTRVADEPALELWVGAWVEFPSEARLLIFQALTRLLAQTLSA